MSGACSSAAAPTARARLDSDVTDRSLESQMATPLRLVAVECPGCHHHHWTLDSDYRGYDLAPLFGMDLGPELSYPERSYQCSGCGETSVGHRVHRRSPPEFFGQPHSTPM